VGGKDGKQCQQHSACAHECLPAKQPVRVPRILPHALIAMLAVFRYK
jgi:hypothetical protein